MENAYGFMVHNLGSDETYPTTYKIALFGIRKAQELISQSEMTTSSSQSLQAKMAGHATEVLEYDEIIPNILETSWNTDLISLFTRFNCEKGSMELSTFNVLEIIFTHIWTLFQGKSKLTPEQLKIVHNNLESSQNFIPILPTEKQVQVINRIYSDILLELIGNRENSNATISDLVKEWKGIVDTEIQNLTLSIKTGDSLLSSYPDTSKSE